MRRRARGKIGGGAALSGSRIGTVGGLLVVALIACSESSKEPVRADAPAQGRQERATPITVEGFDAFVGPTGDEFHVADDGTVRTFTPPDPGYASAVTVYADLDRTAPFEGPVLAVSVLRRKVQGGDSATHYRSIDVPEQGDQADDLRTRWEQTEEPVDDGLWLKRTETLVVGRNVTADEFDAAVAAVDPSADPPEIDTAGLPDGVEPVATGPDWRGVFGQRTAVSDVCTSDGVHLARLHTYRGEPALASLIVPFLDTPTATIVRGQKGWRGTFAIGPAAQTQQKVVAWGERGAIVVAATSTDTPDAVLDRLVAGLRFVDEPTWAAFEPQPLCAETTARIEGEVDGDRSEQGRAARTP